MKIKVWKIIFVACTQVILINCNSDPVGPDNATDTIYLTDTLVNRDTLYYTDTTTSAITVSRAESLHMDLDTIFLFDTLPTGGGDTVFTVDTVYIIEQRMLNISRAGIYDDISFIIEYPSLEWVDLSEITYLKDYTPLHSLPNLKCLILVSYARSDLAFMESMNTVKHLDISYSDSLKNIDALAGLTNLEFVNVYKSFKIEDHTPLLSCLGTGDTLVADLLNKQLPDSIIAQLRSQGVYTMNYLY